MTITEPQFAGFEPITEVAADDRVRVALTKAGAHAADRYLMSASPATGEILLTPITSIPKRELLVWENEALRASLQLGIAEASAGLARPAEGVIDQLESR